MIKICTSCQTHFTNDKEYLNHKCVVESYKPTELQRIEALEKKVKELETLINIKPQTEIKETKKSKK